MAGIDRLEGGSGNDLIPGGTGNDVLLGQDGADTFDGGAGVDSVSYEGALGSVSASLTSLAATGADGDDTFVASTIENLVGSPFDNTLTGDGLANRLEGAAGRRGLLVGGMRHLRTRLAGSALPPAPDALDAAPK